MPENLVLVRHGQSEGNVAFNHPEELECLDQQDLALLSAKHDWQYRLGSKGVEQATATGRWLTANLMSTDKFDGRFVSPYLRALETAAYLGGLNCTWEVDDRLRERDMGTHFLPGAEEEGANQRSGVTRLGSRLMWRPENGEALLPDVVPVAKGWLDWLGSNNYKNVLAVSHGEKIATLRYIIEGMMMPEAEEMLNQRALGNGDILHYTRVSPEDNNEVIEPGMGLWRKIVRPGADSNWEWVEQKRNFTGGELLAEVGCSPALLQR